MVIYQSLVYTSSLFGFVYEPLSWGVRNMLFASDGHYS